MIILCTVDITTREVTIPSDQRIASYDHKVDVIRFQVETIPGFSLDTSSIKIAAQGPNKARHDYAVDPSTVQIEEETGYITFDWPIPAGVTEMPIGTFKYGDKGQLIFAVCAEIIDGSTVSKAWHSDDGIITVVAHLEPEAGGGEDPEETATNAQKIAQLQTDVAVINTQVGALANGSPTPVSTVAEMTDESAVYLYTGSETGYTAGNWYYYDGTAWTSGGTYGGAVTDSTLTQDAPANARAVGQALAEKADADDVDAIDDRVTALETEGIPTNVKQAIYTLLSSAVYNVANLTDEKAIIESWASVVTSISISLSTVSISGNGTQQLTASTTPSGGVIVWSSSNENVASVSNTGLVTSVGNGTCTITASCGDVSATCAVTVTGFYAVSNVLTLATNSNIATGVVNGSSYNATIAPSAGCTLSSVSVTMGGTDITSTAYDNGTITISSVTGDIVITATAVTAHPLVQGTHTFSDTSYITVSGNHVKCYMASSHQGNNGYQFNYLDINDNTSTSKTTTANANNKTSKFTIPASTECTVSIKNIVADGVTDNGSSLVLENNRTAGGTASVGSAAMISSSTTDYEFDSDGNIMGSYSKTFTLESSADIGAMYLYAGQVKKNGATIEFDVELFVGSSRYI